MVKALLLDKKNQSVLLSVVLIPTKLVQPPLAMFIEIIFKNMSHKQLQLTTTKETPVIEPRFQIKFDLPVFLPLNVVQPPAYQAPAYQASATKTQSKPKEDLKGITTRSGVAYKGPTIHTTSSPKVVERDTEVTKDTMPPTNNRSTKDVPPLVVPIFHHESISEPVNAPVSASRPNQKALIPFPSRRNDERRR
ncbi:hypothetical protein Tco_0082878, partial [Tanacetum coccineum]